MLEVNRCRAVLALTDEVIVGTLVLSCKGYEDLLGRRSPPHVHGDASRRQGACCLDRKLFVLAEGPHSDSVGATRGPRSAQGTALTSSRLPHPPCAPTVGGA